MADTRRDKRAPVALKVRYKSATVDEFLEHYSEDISRGGTFIKSKKPMAVGTLLKFELQLQDESRLIHGVGRVVWKREEAESSEGKPPGMGIKFIKMDAESRALVQKILETRGDGPGKFDAQAEDGSNGSAGTGSGAFFPSTTPEEEQPAPEDRTAVRHASEFLAEALADTDEAAATEARVGAEEARKRTEAIERERAQSLPPEGGQEQAARSDIGVADTLIASTEGAGPEAAEQPSSAAPAEAAEMPPEPSSPEPEGELEGATTLPRRPIVEPAPSQPATSPEGAASQPVGRGPRSRALPVAVALVAVGLVAYLVASNTGMLGGAEAPDDTVAAVEGVDLVEAPPVGGAADDPVGAAEPEPEGEPEAAAEPEVLEVAVPVRTEGAPRVPVTWLVDGTEVGEGLDEIPLPVDEAVTVRAVAPGYTSEPQTVTAAEDGHSPLVFELAEMPHMLMVESEPPGVRVRAGGGRVTTPGRLRVRRPADPVVITATRAGFQPLREEMALSEFRANHDEGEMQATIELTLQPAPQGRTGAKAAAPTKAGEKEAAETAQESEEEGQAAAAEAPAPQAAEQPEPAEPEPAEPEPAEPKPAEPEPAADE